MSLFSRFSYDTYEWGEAQPPVDWKSGPQPMKSTNQRSVPESVRCRDANQSDSGGRIWLSSRAQPFIAVNFIYYKRTYNTRLQIHAVYLTQWLNTVLHLLITDFVSSVHYPVFFNYRIAACTPYVVPLPPDLALLLSPQKDPYIVDVFHNPNTKVVHLEPFANLLPAAISKLHYIWARISISIAKPAPSPTFYHTAPNHVCPPSECWH